MPEKFQGMVECFKNFNFIMVLVNKELLTWCWVYGGVVSETPIIIIMLHQDNQVR